LSAQALSDVRSSGQVGFIDQLVPENRGLCDFPPGETAKEDGYPCLLMLLNYSLKIHKMVCI
jgi:hypothetical protein